MSRIHNTWKIIQNLSLDVALGSAAGGALATHVLSVPMPFAWWILLPLVVFFIYNLDHIIDGIRMQKIASTERHRAHQKYIHFTLPATVLLGILLFFLILVFLPRDLILWGSIIGVFSLLHLFFAAWKKWKDYPKEVFIALYYTAGIWFGPIVVSQERILTGVKWPALVLFFLSALLNLMVFSYMDRTTDRIDNQVSLVPHLGESLYQTAVHFVFATGLLFWMILLIYNRAMVLTAFVFLIYLLYAPLVLVFEGFFQKNQRYRILGDGLFLLGFLPAIFSQ